MRRFGLIVTLVLMGVLSMGVHRSRADVIATVGALCVTTTPIYSIAPCGPNLSPTAVRSLILPTKDLSIGGGRPGPADTVSYPVTITSSLVCFALNEPIIAYTMGVPLGASVIRQTTPEPIVPSQGSMQQVNVDAHTSQASLDLEVYKGAVGPSGVTLKAVWPAENVERVQVVIPAIPATPTPTATPHVRVTPSGPPPSPPATPSGPTWTPAPTNTPIPTDTPTPTTTPTATSTSTPSGTATPTATPNGTQTATPSPTSTPDTRTFFTRVCTEPATTAGVGGHTTIYVQTLPGAVCTASVRYSPFGFPAVADFDGGPQVALADGLAIFPLTVNNARATTGNVSATCSLNGQSITATTTFSVTQASTPTTVALARTG